MLTAATASGVGRKGQRSSMTDRYRARILDGHRDWHTSILLWRFLRHSRSRLRINQRGGKMATGYGNLRRKHTNVGHEEKESILNRPELAAFVLALHDTPVTKPMLDWCCFDYSMRNSLVDLLEALCAQRLLVWQQSAAEACEKKDERRWKSNVSMNTRHKNTIGNNRRATK